MNIVEAFATYLQTLGIATLGQNLFIGKAPSSLKAVDSLWWIKESGGNAIQKNSTGELIKDYNIDVYYRDADYKNVSDALFNLNTSIDIDKCSQLQGFETIDIQTQAYPVDNDLDSEYRKVGMIQVNITVYKGE